jgi:hypothetical protein
MRRSFSVRWLLLAGIFVVGMLGTSEAAVPPMKFYYWQAGDNPVTMWPTSKGYCFLSGLYVGNALTDEVKVSIVNGNWRLDGVGTAQQGGSEFGIASCVPWPAGYSGPAAPQLTDMNGMNLGDNTCICSLAGVAFDGHVFQHFPQFRIIGYPSSATYVTNVRQNIGNDSAQTPIHKVAGQCLCPTGTSSTLYSTGAGGGITEYYSSPGSNAVMPADKLCVPKEHRASTDGAFSFQIWQEGANWIGYSPLRGVTTWYCVDYPGPVVQMDVGSTNVFTDSSGPNWAADAGFSGGASYSTSNTISLTGADRPAPMAVYQNVRSGNSMTYGFYGYLPSSIHTVRLHFAEAWFSGAGQRKFDVYINGTKVLPAFDVAAQAGGVNKAVVRSFTAIALSGGQFVIQFMQTNPAVSTPIVSAIEIQ